MNSQLKRPRSIGAARGSPECPTSTLVAIAEAVTGIVKEMPDGIHRSDLERAVIGLGASATQFDAIMVGLIGTGRVTKAGEVYQPGENFRILPCD